MLLARTPNGGPSDRSPAGWRPRLWQGQLTILALCALAGPAQAVSYSLRASLLSADGGGGAGSAVTTVGPYTVVGAPSLSRASVYDRVGGTLVRTLVNPNPSPGDDFGAAVAGHGQTSVIIGAPLEDNAGGTDAGAVYVFDVATGGVLHRFLKPTNPTANAKFGNAVAAGWLNRIVIGCEGDDAGATDSGAVFLFYGPNQNYDLLWTLKKPSPALGDRLGFSVLGLANVVAGAPGENNGSGAVYQWDTSSAFTVGTGDLMRTATNPFPGAGDNFGYALAASGGNIAVGTPYEDMPVANAGAVYLMNFTPNPPVLTATLQKPAPQPAELFGFSLAGGTLVGAPLVDGGAADAGAAYLFNAAAPYELLFTFTNPSAAVGDAFGAAVSGGCQLVVGAPNDDTLATDGGAAYLYEATLPSCNVSGTPAEIGSWSPVTSWPVVAIHASVLHTGTRGKVLFWEGSDPLDLTPTYTWDAELGSVQRQGDGARDMFCAGHASLADGRIISIGGHAEVTVTNGIKTTNIFAPGTGLWSNKADMKYARWYPTATTLWDGRVLATSGWATNQTPSDIPEIYDVGKNCWRELSLNTTVHLDLYPFMFLLPNGKLFQAGRDGGGATLTRTLTVSAGPECTHAATGTWGETRTSPFNGGSAVLYRAAERVGPAAVAAGKVLKTGGGNPAVASAAIIDMMEASPAWSSVPGMTVARVNHNLVTLPDGQVLAIGGSSVEEGEEGGAAMPVLAAERWDPISKVWTPMACMSEPRMYHSTAVLLPDARVLAAGGNCFPSYQIYSPPYLHAGPQPMITSAPTSAVYNTAFTVGVSEPASSIESVAFIRSGSVTHAFDENQRFVAAAFSVVNSTTLSVTAPANELIAPPGYYMLFVVSNQRVPSVARFVRLSCQEGLSCDDANECTSSDTCSSGKCVGTPTANGTPCASDNNSCTTDQCQSGACVHTCQVGQTCGGGCPPMQCALSGSTCLCQ